MASLDKGKSHTLMTDLESHKPQLLPSPPPARLSRCGFWCPSRSGPSFCYGHRHETRGRPHRLCVSQSESTITFGPQPAGEERGAAAAAAGSADGAGTIGADRKWPTPALEQHRCPEPGSRSLRGVRRNPSQAVPGRNYSSASGAPGGLFLCCRRSLFLCLSLSDPGLPAAARSPLTGSRALRKFAVAAGL